MKLNVELKQLKVASCRMRAYGWVHYSILFHAIHTFVPVCVCAMNPET